MIRHSISTHFRTKIVAALALTVAANLIVFDAIPGSVVGIIALVWLGLCAVMRHGWAHDRRGQIAAVCAALMALVLFDRPGLLALALYGVALMVAMQSSRVQTGEDSWRWFQRLVVHLIAAFAGPFRDTARLLRIRNRSGKATPLHKALALLILPVMGAAVFVSLFSMANPLFASLIAQLRLPPLGEDNILRLIFAALCFVGFYGIFRPRWRRKLFALPARDPRSKSSAIPTVSIILSLVVFNLIFALQNGLDLAFLWSDAPLPATLTLADYAHRGAYPLIVTALLAGLFVLVFLSPTSASAQSPWVRRMVGLWVAQNLFLVASSLLRTADYIEAFGLTRLRLAAMIWMVLVGVGLGLIFWRLLKGLSANWLINANVLTALCVLGVVSAIDLGAVTARWNTTHALKGTGPSASLDLCYLNQLGGSATVPLAELSRRTTDPARKARLDNALADRVSSLKQRQSDWRSWRWRDARRLSHLQSLPPAPAAYPAPSSPYSCAI